MHALKTLGRHPLFSKGVVDTRDLRAAADQPEVFEVARGKRAHCFEIVLMAARHDDDVCRRRQLDPVKPLGDWLDDDFGAREALRICELLAIVDHVDAESDVCGSVGEVKSDVARAHDEKAR
jgi:hypothetical protein